MSSDGSLLATGGSPSRESLARGGVRGPPPFRLEIWNVAQRRVIARLPTTLSIGPIEFSRDLRHVALVDDVRPAVDELPSGRSVPLIGGHPCPAGWRSAAFSSDARLVAAADFCGDVFVWDAARGQMRTSFNNGGEISRIAFAPNNDARLAVGSWNSKITIWNIRSRRPAWVLTGHTGGVSSIAYSSDGSLLASTSLDHTARIWDPANGRLLRVLQQPGPVFGVSFSPDGRSLATGDTKGIVRIWDACSACGNAKALLAIAKHQVTRQLTPLERSTFLGGY